MGNGTAVNRRRAGRVNYRRDMDLAEMTGEKRTVRPNRWLSLSRAGTYLRTGDSRPEPLQPKAAARTNHPIRLGIDSILLLVISTLIIIGLLMVFSASWEYALVEVEGNPTSIFVRQLIFVLAGSIAAVVLAFIDYHHWKKFAVPMMLLTIFALAAVLVVGDMRHGAIRALFGGSIQPSELAKLVAIIYLSVWLHAKRDQLSSISFGLLPLMVMLGAFSGLIFLQPDLSAAVTIVVMGAILFFLGGGDMKQIVLLVVGVVVIGGLIVSVTATGSDRWSTFLPGLQDPTQASYHVRRSFEAFVKGGWLGVGIGKADTKHTGLPVPHTDSIFAVIGEETGVLGSAALVLLFGLLLWRGLAISKRAPDGLGKLLAAGLTIWLVLEAFVNMAVMVGLLPFAGNALPFISAGGSNLMVSMAAIGMLFNISRMAAKNRDEEERTLSAVVDLRRRDWRRSQSRSRRTASASDK